MMIFTQSGPFNVTTYLLCIICSFLIDVKSGGSVTDLERCVFDSHDQDTY
jgi:hypothetical protein